MDDVTGDSPTLDPALAAIGDVVAGRYRLRRTLGRGATKVVYLAHDDRLDREVALALVTGELSAAARARVVREAHVTGRLGDHPNVVTAYDAGELDDGTPYLVLRAMRGGSLADRLREHGPSVAVGVRAGRDVAAALAHAHGAGVVHRDVKPDNVWLDEAGVAALGDFGVAHAEGDERLTRAGGVVGTVRYVAPEQIRGEPPSAASDLYALGVTLYESVCGRAPFDGGDPTTVFAQHLEATPEPLSARAPGVPPMLEALIAGLLAKDPARRPGSAAEVRDALDALLAEDAGAAAVGTRRVVWALAVRVAVADPEALHAQLTRCRTLLRHHGATIVGTTAGDELLALFGASGARDDDGLRALRAALALRADTPAAAIGVETGEAFLVGRESATGVPIGTAARLAGEAEAASVALGPAAREAAGEEAEVDAGGRLLALRRAGPALLRAPAAPFVGRRAQRAALDDAFRTVVAERICAVVTLVGPAGIGKSRLAGELVAALGDEALVLAGACEPSGEGSGLRALDDLLRGIGGDDPGPRLRTLLDGDERAVASLLGAVGRVAPADPVQPEETAWALRRALERLAADRPVVVALEDLHWAGDPLLDLLDHVAALAAGAPLLLLCLTRPELLDRRPTWAAPHPRRHVVLLDVLADDDARALAAHLGAPDAAAVAARAEGNPLFVEQLVAVAPDADALALPLSIQAVLSARIDGLGPAQRTLLQRAAVEGRTFHLGGLKALLPADGLHARLVDLVRQGLVATDRPLVAGEDAFRFTHALLRDAAYASLAKHTRAELHAALATWLGDRPAMPDEAVAHHLERACALRAELGQDADPDLAARAAGRLGAAANAALDRADPSAAAAFLQRAADLLAESDPPAAAALLPALGAALFQAGRLHDAARVLDAAAVTAPAERLRARAAVERGFVALEAGAADDVEEVATRARATLEREGDVEGQARAWALAAQALWTAGRIAEADAAWRRAERLAERAGDRRERFAILGWRATAAVLGPRPVTEAIMMVEALRDVVAASPVAVVWMVNPLASLHAMRGAFDTARALVDEANATLHQLGSLGASVSHHEALVHLLAGDGARAAAGLRPGVETLTAMDDRALLATTAAMLAQALVSGARTDAGDAEAERLCALAAEAAADDDLATHALWRSVRSLVVTRRGGDQQAEAIALARQAVTLLAPTDLLSHRADAMLVLADVLRGASRPDDATETARAALALYERKGNLVGAGRARSLMDAEGG
ncbi:MAG TPA: protein kinase [Baekduia sp.]